jgi:GntR family transcriptional regulator, transcriptional repressor for pyruvate dehydrogenase complex
MVEVNPFKQLSKAEYIEQELEKLVLSDTYKEGDRLPSQSELSNRFNVGTRIIREALKHLEAKGLISMQQGKGVFVRKQKLDFFLKTLTRSFSYELPQNKKVLIDLTNTREIIEIQAILSFIDHPDYRLLEKLQELVDKMGECKNNENLEEYRTLDVEFHKKLVSCMDNDVINYMYKHLTSLVLYSMANTEKVYDSSGYSDHQLIIKYLFSNNKVEAVECMKHHFRTSIESIKKLEY